MSIFPLSLTLLLVISLLGNARHSEGIISNRAVNHRDYPYLVSLRNESGHYCAGALITTKHVLTTAYCMYVDEAIYLGTSKRMYKPEDIKAVVGTTCEDLSACTHQAVALMPHPLFIVRELDRMLFDIGIVTLEDVIENVIAVKLAYNFPRGRDIASIIGWDTAHRKLISLRYPPNTLRKLDIRVQDNDFCRNLFATSLGRWLTSDLKRLNVICGKTKIGMGTSFRDSGSPLVKNNELHGFVISRFTYNISLPEVCVSTREHLEWINYQVAKDSIHRTCDLSSLRVCQMKRRSYMWISYLVVGIMFFIFGVLVLNSILSYCRKGN